MVSVRGDRARQPRLLVFYHRDVRVRLLVGRIERIREDWVGKRRPWRKSGFEGLRRPSSDEVLIRRGSCGMRSGKGVAGDSTCGLLSSSDYSKIIPESSWKRWRFLICGTLADKLTSSLIGRWSPGPKSKFRRTCDTSLSKIPG